MNIREWIIIHGSDDGFVPTEEDGEPMESMYHQDRVEQLARRVARGEPLFQENDHTATPDAGDECYGVGHDRRALTSHCTNPGLDGRSNRLNRNDR